MENHNSEQDIEIKGLKGDIHYIKKALEEIKKRVDNEIPHQIAALSEQTNKQIKEINKAFSNYQLSNSRWLVGILVTLLFVLIGVIIK